jgi:hypothetical protein
VQVQAALSLQAFLRNEQLTDQVRVRRRRLVLDQTCLVGSHRLGTA